MKTKEEMQKVCISIIKKIEGQLTEDETETLLLSSEYAAISNLIESQSEHIRFLIYRDLKEEFGE